MYKKGYTEIYIVDFGKLQEEPVFKESYKIIGDWLTSTGKRWMCRSEQSPAEFKDWILNHVEVENLEDIVFYKDYLPFSTNGEIPF